MLCIQQIIKVLKNSNQSKHHMVWLSHFEAHIWSRLIHALYGFSCWLNPGVGFYGPAHEIVVRYCVFEVLAVFQTLLKCFSGQHHNTRHQWHQTALWAHFCTSLVTTTSLVRVRFLTKTQNMTTTSNVTRCWVKNVKTCNNISSYYIFLLYFYYIWGRCYKLSFTKPR